MAWTRPVPLIGDGTSAHERAGDPQAWAFPVEQREALHNVIAARRDIRRFRPEGIAEQVLTRVLAAAHAAPSVGHSQPWRFVLVRAAQTRDRAAALADRERLAQAAQLTGEAGRRLRDLQLEGIREAPLGVVVCCDRRVPAAGVLGRATFPDADLWSCACAIQNLWLAARAEGLGVGWVTLFRPADLAELLGLPDGVVTLGWLCLGWPDERPPAPGLERAGWSRRAPLADVLLSERWPAADRPPPPSQLQAPAPRAVVAARDAGDDRLSPPGALGLLDRTLDRLLALPRPGIETGTLVLAAADHPVTAHGVSAYPAAVTAEVLAAAVAGEAAGCAAAAAAGLAVRVVDAGVTASRSSRELVVLDRALELRPAGPVGDLVTADGLSIQDAASLLERGRHLGAGLAERGAVLLGEVGVGNTTVAAALTAGLLRLGAAEVVGLGAGADSAMLARKVAVVAAALARVGPREAPLELLAALGGPEFAVLAGVTLGAAGAGGVVLLDGLATSVAALVAARLEPAVTAHLVAGQRSREAAHPLVLTELGLEPLLDLRIRAGEGVGACLALTLLRAAAQTRAATARVSPAQAVRSARAAGPERPPGRPASSPAGTASATP